MKDTVPNDTVYAQKVAFAYSNHMLGLVATFAGAPILAIVQWNVIPHSVLLAWVLLMCGISVIRIFHRRTHQRHPEQTHNNAFLFILGTTIGGIGWGVGGYILYPAHALANQMFLTFMIGGMVAGASVTNSSIRGAFPAFAIPAIVPISIILFRHADGIHIGMATMIVLFFLLMSIVSRRIHRILTDTIRLRFENADLIGQLTEARDNAQELNRQLAKEIKERERTAVELQRHRDNLESLVHERTEEVSRANTELTQLLERYRRTSDALRRSEERHRKLIENATDGIVIVSDGGILFTNPMMQQITGYSASDLTGIGFRQLIHDDDIHKLDDLRQAKERNETMPRDITFRFYHKNGDVRWITTSTVPIEWDGQEVLLAFIRDITEQRLIQEELRTMQKLESLGSLAGGIAHDFNNILMEIQGSISLMMLDIPNDHQFRDQFDNIGEYVQRGAGLTRQLLDFAHRRKSNVSQIDINDIINRTLALFARTRKEIVFSSELQPSLPAITADPGRIEQVLMNLFINAWQAMPSGGELQVCTSLAHIETGEINNNTLISGEYIRMTVSDTGIGMNESTLQRIFEPFYTTKKQGRGTGLGLATVYGIIKSHDGHIEATSVPGKGSTFTIYLPACNQPCGNTMDADTEISRGSENILVIDDEEVTLNICSKMLRRLGYNVITADSGKEAVSFLNSQNEIIDLVILDLVMPGMDGVETFDQLRDINSGIKVLLASGYSEDHRIKRLLDKGCRDFLQKPFALHVLSGKVRTVLDS